MQSSYLIDIPDSHFPRSYSPKLKYLDRLRLHRITFLLQHVADRGEIYHLWWHLYNFAINLAENLSFLEQILQSYRSLILIPKSHWRLGVFELVGLRLRCR